MNRGGIRKKLLLSHIGVALGSLLTIILLVNLVMTYSFGKYIENLQQAEAAALLEDLEASYDPANNWTSDTLMGISHQAVQRNYIIRIYDNQQNLVLDTSQMSLSMHSTGADGGTLQVIGKTNVIKNTIMKDGYQIGTLEMQGTDGPLQLQNQRFLRMFNFLLWAALILVLVGAYLFSGFIATGISRPLVRIKQIAAQMREGDLSQRVVLAGHSTEIAEVGLALNHLADALQQQEKLRKNLTADVAHELRTPLATIQSHIEAFQDGVWEATPDKLQICHGQVIRLVQLINDLEKLTALENPMLQLRKEKVCLNEVIHDSINAVSGQFNDKHISLEVHETNKVYMTGDYARLVQVFVNLLNNACKYTNEGSIFVGIFNEQSEIKVTIRDTGVGIAPDELPFIFERFYRGEKSRNRKTGGAGIGLAVVKAIVEAHGGKVTVQSTINQGSEFIVRFPE